MDFEESSTELKGCVPYIDKVEDVAWVMISGAFDEDKLDIVTNGPLGGLPAQTLHEGATTSVQTSSAETTVSWDELNLDIRALVDEYQGYSFHLVKRITSVMSQKHVHTYWRCQTNLLTAIPHASPGTLGLNKQLDGEPCKEFIRPSTSPYSSPMLFVKKPEIVSPTLLPCTQCGYYQEPDPATGHQMHQGQAEQEGAITDPRNHDMSDISFAQQGTNYP